MRKTLLVLSIINVLFIGEAVAEDIHLRCNIGWAESNSAGKISTGKGYTNVTVSESENYLQIVNQSEIAQVNNLTVTSLSGESHGGITVEGTNKSTPNRWDVFNVLRWPDSTSVRVRIIIERTTGTFTITANHDSPTFQTQVDVLGNCEKPSAPRKF